MMDLLLSGEYALHEAFKVSAFTYAYTIPAFCIVER
jgi:hypothetical protein